MKRVFFIFGLLLLIGLPILAQDVIPIPDDWTDVITQMNLWFGSLAGIAAITTFLAATLNGLLKVTSKFIRQLVAWVVAILLLIASSVFNFGFAAEFPVLKAVVYGVGAGLVANGMFDIPWVKAILDKVDAFFVPKPPVV